MEKEIYGMGIALLGALTNPEHEEDKPDECYSMSASY
jgi:hypothetical protein